MKQLDNACYKIYYKGMIQQPIQAPIETKSQVKSQSTQNKIRHRYWLMLQCEFWIFNLFIASLSFYILSQFAKADTQANSIYNTTQQLQCGGKVQNCCEICIGYIIDIKEVNTDNCPQGYKELISYYWPGTYEGCYCQTIVNNHASEYILQGACSSQLIAFGCTTIAALTKQNMKMWKGSKLLCYKRVDSLNFYNSTLTATPQGVTMKNCAKDKDYQVNTLPDVACPASVIANTSIGTSTQTTLVLDSNSLLKLFYENQQNYPISDFKLTQYNFCPYWSENNISPEKSGNYILELTNFSATCTGSDPRIVEFDYLTQEDFFTNNTRVYDMISSLPGYPRPSISYYYRLGFIRHAAWTYSCRTTDSHNLLMATKHLNFIHITEKTKLVLYVGVPCVLLVSILARILYILRHIFEIKAKKEYNMVIMTDQEVGQQIPNLNIVKSFKRELFLFILEILLILATLVVLCIAAYNLIQQSLWIKETFNKKCTEDHLNWIFRYYEDKVDICGFIVGRTIMFTVVILLVEIAHFVIRNKFGDLKETELPPPESLSNEGLIKQDLDQKNMMNGDSMNIQDSSDIILRKEKEELKVYDLDNFMSNELQGGAGQTGLNFYAQQSIEQENFQIAKKKKKKGVKRKNLFKEGEEK